MIESLGSFKNFLKSDTINAYLDTESYIIDSLTFYANEYLPVHGRYYANYLLVSVEYRSELFLTTPFLSRYAKNLGLFYNDIISCMYRLLDARCAANMMGDEAFSEYVQSKAKDAYCGLVDLYCQYNLYIFFDTEYCIDWFEAAFYTDALSWRMFEDSMNPVPGKELKQIKYEADVVTKFMKGIANSEESSYSGDLEERLVYIDDVRSRFCLPPICGKGKKPS